MFALMCALILTAFLPENARGLFLEDVGMQEYKSCFPIPSVYDVGGVMGEWIGAN